MNEHQLRQQQIMRARQKFLSELSVGAAAPLDRFGNRIAAGAKILFHLPVDQVYDVLSVTPVFDPNAPPGVLSVQLTVTFPWNTMANRPSMEAILMSQAPSEQAKPQPDEPAAPPAAPADDVDGPRGIELTDPPPL